MSKLKAGVIGYGMGKGHADGYFTHPDVELVAVADGFAAKREAAASAYKVRTYETGAELLAKEKLDIVSIVVPNAYHKELTIAALESGANVLCEKPMALNAAEAEEMLAAAKRVNRKLGINFSFRFTPQSRAMKSLVEAGKLGNIYHARSVWLRRRGIPGLQPGQKGSWFFEKERAGGGPLIDLGVHRLDLALWLMGYPEPAWVMGSTQCAIAPKWAADRDVKYTVEDFACATVKFKNGATLELNASWAANIKEREQMSTRLLGDKGGLYQYNLDEGYNFEVELYEELNNMQFDTKLHPPVPDAKNAYHTFAEAVRDDKPFLVAAEEGVTVMRLLDAIYESAATNRPIQFA